MIQPKCPWGDHMSLGIGVSYSLTDLTLKTYVTFYYYLFVGNYCGLIRIECFISNFVLWRGCLCIPEIVCTKEEAKNSQ